MQQIKLNQQEEQKLLAKIKSQHYTSDWYVKQKRERFKEYLRLYNNQRKYRDKIGIPYIYTALNILLSVDYADEKTVRHTGRKEAMQEYADKWDKLAKFDYDEMGLNRIKYVNMWDRRFFGVGIRGITSFDENTQTPIVESLDPMSWLPDPNCDVLNSKRSGDAFRWHWFELLFTKEEMTEDRGFIKHKIDKVLNKECQDKISELEQTIQARNEAYGLNSVLDDLKSNGVDSIHAFNWILNFEDKKLFVTVDSKIQNVLRSYEMTPVYEEEKNDWRKIPTPLTLYYMSPQRNNPFGISTCDMTEDKQRFMSTLINLRASAEKSKIYPMYLYNRNKVLNRRDLDFGFDKFIPINGDVDSGTIQPMQKDVWADSGTVQLEQTVKQYWDQATWADELQAGVVSQGSRTAHEINQASVNSNVRFELDADVYSWAEIDFWKLWMRSYRENFNASKEKIIRVTSALGNKFIRLRRKDFITVEDPDIYIESTTKMESERKEQMQSFSAIYPIINQNPDRPYISKKFAERHLLELHWLDKEEINIMSPKSADEMRASRENELISANDFIPIDMNKDDHLSHMIIHESAENTYAKEAHIEKHLQAYMLVGGSRQDAQRAMQDAQNMEGRAAQAESEIRSQAFASDEWNVTPGQEPPKPSSNDWQ